MVGVCEVVCTVYVSPAMCWGPVKGVAGLSPSVSWDRLQSPCDPAQYVVYFEYTWGAG